MNACVDESQYKGSGKLKGKTAIITGGTSFFIPRAIALCKKLTGQVTRVSVDRLPRCLPVKVRTSRSLTCPRRKKSMSRSLYRPWRLKADRPVPSGSRRLSRPMARNATIWLLT